MKYSEKWGDSIDSAVEYALQDLKLTRDQVTITVLEEPSKGFLGIGSKLAKVRVEEIVLQKEKPEKKAEVKEKKAEPETKEQQPKQNGETKKNSLHFRNTQAIHLPNPSSQIMRKEQTRHVGQTDKAWNCKSTASPVCKR